MEAFCEPKWHDGERVKADFMVYGISEEIHTLGHTKVVAADHEFNKRGAVCEEHLRQMIIEEFEGEAFVRKLRRS